MHRAQDSSCLHRVKSLTNTLILISDCIFTELRYSFWVRELRISFLPTPSAHMYSPMWMVEIHRFWYQTNIRFKSRRLSCSVWSKARNLNFLTSHFLMCKMCAETPVLQSGPCKLNIIYTYYIVCSIQKSCYYYISYYCLCQKFSLTLKTLFHKLLFREVNEGRFYLY